MAPVQDSVWFGGQSRWIRWTTPVGAPTAKISLFVEDTLTGVVGKYAIATLEASSTNEYLWQVPYAFRTSAGYQVTVVAEFDPSLGLAPNVGVSKLFKIVQVGDAGHGKPIFVPSEPDAASVKV